ncbi:MAG: nucleotidyltransferase family protein [Bacteroidales bacterium]|jgi:NDP-sugar pyrophosphorylase family protein|nr:nucleotidyltransferase family protein [Bacteroidales bacterium]
MKAIIFAAGLGTRLGHLTKYTPKALVNIGGKTLLERVILKLKQAGVTDIIINVHHFHEQIIDFVNENNFGINITFSIEENKLLGTGGGLKHAAWFFCDGNPFIIHNVDIISDIHLREMYDVHCRKDVIALLAVRNRTTQRYLLFDDENRLCGKENLSTNERIITPDTSPQTTLHRMAFSGIHIVSPRIFEFMPQGEDVFPITDIYLKIASNVHAYQHDYGKWMDMGKIETVTDFQKLIKEEEEKDFRNDL